MEEPKQKGHKPENIEIIEEHVVPTLRSKVIKIKFKERVSRREKKTKFSLTTKVIVILLAMGLGYIVGAKLISRYIAFWRRAQVEYPVEQEETQTPQLKAGEVYSLDTE